MKALRPCAARARPTGTQTLAPAAGFKAMPSLFRFLIFIGLIAGIGYGAVFALANFVTYRPREITVTIPPDKFLKQPR